MRAARPDPATSARMAGIRQRGTAIETAVGTILRDLGHHYRTNVKGLPGSPDFANRSRRWAVFVNGCFWHAHTACRKATTPKSNTEFWLEKFRDNRCRDARAIRSLRKQGYKVILVWGCEREAMRERLCKIPESGRIEPR